MGCCWRCVAIHAFRNAPSSVSLLTLSSIVLHDFEYCFAVLKIVTNVRQILGSSRTCRSAWSYGRARDSPWSAAASRLARNARCCRAYGSSCAARRSSPLPGRRVYGSSRRICRAAAAAVVLDRLCGIQSRMQPVSPPALATSPHAVHLHWRLAACTLRKHSGSSRVSIVCASHTIRLASHRRACKQVCV